MRSGQLTIYPQPSVTRELDRVCAEDHDRPRSKMAEVAIKAFVTLWRKDRYEALKLADQFDQQPARS